MGFAASSPCTWRPRSGVTAWDFLYTVSGWLSFRGEFITFLIDKNFSNSGEAISEYHEKTHCKTLCAHHTQQFTTQITSASRVPQKSQRIQDAVECKPPIWLAVTHRLASVSLPFLHFWLHKSPVSGRVDSFFLIPLLYRPASPPALHRRIAHGGRPRSLHPTVVSKATAAGSALPLHREAHLSDLR